MIFLRRHGRIAHDDEDSRRLGEFINELESPTAKTITLTVQTDRITTALEHYTPKKIIRNGPATIVFWNNGKKTVVMKADGDADNEYNAFCAALAIRIFGNNSALKRIISEKTEKQI